jgi:nucleoside-diphosphate-sugar epimerase
MAKVLVSGASGFIGYHLVKALLDRGDEVTCLVRRTSNVDRLQRLRVDLAYGDVTDPVSLREAVAGKSAVYHLAGLIKAFRLADLLRVNEDGVRNMAAACAELDDPPVLVIVSSLAAAGPVLGGGLRTETDPPEPVSNYGRSKRAGEMAAGEFADRVPITIVRPPIVFGEADRACLDIFLSIKRFRLHLVPGRTPRKFSFIHAADLAQLLVLAAECGTRLAPAADGDSNDRGYYFADSGEHPTYHQLGHMVGEALGHRRTFSVSCGFPMVWLVAAVSGLAGRIRGTPSYLSIDKAREATAGSWACSGQKAADELGFSVAKPLAERFHQTAQWYRNEKWL